MKRLGRIENRNLIEIFGLLFFPVFQKYKQLLVVPILFISPETFSQWKKIFVSGKPVVSIYFRDFTSFPEDGFVGLRGGGDDQLWRTLDGGILWQKISYPISPFPANSYTPPYCFTFKDKFIGWFCGFQGYSILKTTDGGNTWNLSGDGTGSLSATGIHYVESTGRLIGSVVGAPYFYSTDEGSTYQAGIFPGFGGGVSVTFSDENHGMLSSTQTSPAPPLGDHILYTADGGLTWNNTLFFYEFFQPIGIPNTPIFFAISELGPNVGQVVRSDDGGSTWKKLAKYNNPNTLYSITGTMQYGSEMRLFFQTTTDAADGIMMSEDTGNSFFSICGPTNDQDTRFFVRDTFIYAGDRYGGLWLNTTGIGSNSKPILSSDAIIFRPLTCSGEERIINFTFFDSCNNRQAKLLNASITGNPVFSITKGAEQRIIHPDDSLVIVYTPDSSSKDTDSGQVHLQFKLGWKTFDTTISLLGLGKIVADSIAFIPSLTRNIIASEQVTEYLISPSKAVSGKNLSEVTFDVTLDADLVTPIDFKNYMSRATIDTSSTTLADGFLTYHIRISGNDLLLDPAEAIVRIQLLTYVTDTISTNIALSNIKLNGFDPDYERCTLSASSRDMTFTLALLCGDRTIVDFMRHGRNALEITSIKPNPARDEVTVEIMSELNDAVIIEIYDALGNLVQTQDADRMSALRTLVVSVDKLSSGSYVMRVSSGGSVVSRGFVVER
jgi:hypothetical protein